MHGSCARSHRRNPPYERHRHYDKVVAAAADAETTDRPIVPRAPMVYRVVVTAVYNHNCRPRLLLIKFFPLSSSFDRTVFFFQTLHYTNIVLYSLYFYVQNSCFLLEFENDTEFYVSLYSCFLTLLSFRAPYDAVFTERKYILSSNRIVLRRSAMKN